MVTNILEEHIASIFRVKVEAVGDHIATFMGLSSFMVFVKLWWKLLSLLSCVDLPMGIFAC
jgi:hypothetical protein